MTMTATEPQEAPRADPFAKARAAKAARAAQRAAHAEPPAAPAAADPAIAELKAMVAALAEQNKGLAAQVQKLSSAPPLSSTPGPEKKLQDFIKSMRPGEHREGIKEVRDSDIVAMEGAYRSGDIVRIKPDTARAVAWSKTQKDGGPIYGQVLQYLGRTENKRGPRKYKVHFQGVGRDGVTENEIELVKSA